MARFGKRKTVQKSPEVTFILELRPEKPEQKEAGKRLFARLIARAVSVGADCAAACQEGQINE